MPPQPPKPLSADFVKPPAKGTARPVTDSSNTFAKQSLVNDITHPSDHEVVQPTMHSIVKRALAVAATHSPLPERPAVVGRVSMSLRFEVPIYERLKALSSRTGVSAQRLCDAALAEYLDRMEA